MRRQEIIDITRIRVQFFDKDVDGGREEIIVTPREWTLFSSKSFDGPSSCRNMGVTLYEGAENERKRYRKTAGRRRAGIR